MKIKLNPNGKIVRKVRRAVLDNDGYCPCRLTKDEDTKCKCKEFREQVARGKPGMCKCGLFVAIDEEEN